MNRKYAIITGFMGSLQDRFANYQPKRTIEEMVKMASKVKGCSGLEIVYPQNFTDPVAAKKLLDSYGLGVSTVNLNVKGEEKWRYGSFSSVNPAIRREAVEYLKTAMDAAAELGCNIVTTALLNDGQDYPFEIDQYAAFMNALEGITEAAHYRKDVKISLEYKMAEPRVHCLLNNAGKIAYFAQMTGCDNVGVTLDTGHAFQCLEVPADSASFLAATNRLFYVHINDNPRNWDWDMLPGVINLVEFIEFAHALNKVNYHGWITADVFPGRYDPTKIMEKTFEWMDYIFDIADRIDTVKLKEMQDNLDNFGILDYIRSLM
jgi:xylose isomerase